MEKKSSHGSCLKVKLFLTFTFNDNRNTLKLKGIYLNTTTVLVYYNKQKSTVNNMIYDKNDHPIK